MPAVNTVFFWAFQFVALPKETDEVPSVLIHTHSFKEFCLGVSSSNALPRVGPFEFHQIIGRTHSRNMAIYSIQRSQFEVYTIEDRPLNNCVSIRLHCYSLRIKTVFNGPSFRSCTMKYTSRSGKVLYFFYKLVSFLSSVLSFGALSLHGAF